MYTPIVNTIEKIMTNPNTFVLPSNEVSLKDTICYRTYFYKVEIYPLYYMSSCVYPITVHMIRPVNVYGFCNLFYLIKLVPLLRPWSPRGRVSWPWSTTTSLYPYGMIYRGVILEWYAVIRLASQGITTEISITIKGIVISYHSTFLRTYSSHGIHHHSLARQVELRSCHLQRQDDGWYTPPNRRHYIS